MEGKKNRVWWRRDSCAMRPLGEFKVEGSFAPVFAFLAEDSRCATLFGEPAFHAAFKAPEQSPALLGGEGLFVEVVGWRSGVGGHGSLLAVLRVVYAEQ